MEPDNQISCFHYRTFIAGDPHFEFQITKPLGVKNWVIAIICYIK